MLRLLPSGAATSRFEALGPIAAILVACAASSAGAQTAPRADAQQTAPAAPPAPPPRIGVASAPPAQIAIEDVIRLALEHNTDVAVARLAREAARQDVRAAEGVFDVRLLPTFSYQRTATPSTSELSGGAGARVEERRLGGALGVDALSPWGGGHLTVDFNATRFESSNQFLRLNPQFPSFFGATYTQPLLRGLHIDEARRQILLTRRATDLSTAQLATVLMDQLALVERAYWDVVFGTRFLEVQVTRSGRLRPRSPATNARRSRARSRRSTWWKRKRRPPHSGSRSRRRSRP